MTQTDADRIPTEHFESMDRLESTYWWHQNRIKIATALLSTTDLQTPRMLDLGCGTGNFAETLGRNVNATQIIGVDASPTAIEYSREKQITVFDVDLTSPQQVEDGNYDLVTAMDVIEHMENESSILQSAHVNLRSGGYLLVSAPAYNFLFSQWDRQLQHHRRYTRGMFRKLIEPQMFTIQRCTYAFAYALPPAILRRLLSKENAEDKCEFPPVPNCLNALLSTLGTLEGKAAKHINLPAGLSVYMLLKKV